MKNAKSAIERRGFVPPAIPDIICKTIPVSVVRKMQNVKTDRPMSVKILFIKRTTNVSIFVQTSNVLMEFLLLFLQTDVVATPVIVLPFANPVPTGNVRDATPDIYYPILHARYAHQTRSATEAAAMSAKQAHTESKAVYAPCVRIMPPPATETPVLSAARTDIIVTVNHAPPACNNARHVPAHHHAQHARTDIIKATTIVIDARLPNLAA